MDKVDKRLKTGPSYGERVFVANNAIVIGDVSLGDDVSIWYGCIIRGDVDKIVIGKSSNIQDGSVVHVTKDKFPVIIGENTTVGHAVTLHGCVIGDNVLVGIGSIILDGVKIGNNSIVAAGSLIPPNKVFPDNSFIMGHPAKLVRETTEEEIKSITENGQRYLKYKEYYLENERIIFK